MVEGGSGRFDLRRSGPFRLLSAEPPILYMADWATREPRAAIHRVFRHLRRRRTYILYAPSWHLDSPSVLRQTEQHLRAHLRRHPEHRVVVLCATDTARAALEGLGLPAIFCNKNCLADQRIYRPLPDVSKVYDAVYTARLSPFKRHELAAGVKSLALIASVYEGRIDPTYGRAVREALAHAHWFNDPFAPAFRVLEPAQVVLALSRCRVGLCLSAAEGQMKGSIEYLLCGLPVVSTPSLGGRDVFFDEACAQIVEPTPDAVRRGVEAMVRRSIPPEMIRQHTLDRIGAHRRRLIALVQEIYAGEGVTRDFAAEWERVYCNYLVDYRIEYPEVIAALDGAK
jgi:glycosyltransferase involved in cell wall biosynthesis